MKTTEENQAPRPTNTKEDRDGLSVTERSETIDEMTTPEEVADYIKSLHPADRGEYFEWINDPGPELTRAQIEGRE